MGKPLRSTTPSRSFFLILRPPPRSTLFPYTTLFRSSERSGPASIGCRWSRPISDPHCGCRRSRDRKSTRLNSSHTVISYAVFCLKKKKQRNGNAPLLPRYRRYEKGLSDLLAREGLKL